MTEHSRPLRNIKTIEMTVSEAHIDAIVVCEPIQDQRMDCILAFF